LGTELENWLQGTSLGDKTEKIGYRVLLLGTELENWLQGTSLGDRTGKLFTGYFS